MSHSEYSNDIILPRTPLTDADSAVAMDFSDITDQECWDQKACLTPVKRGGSGSSGPGPGALAGGLGSASSIGHFHRSCPQLFDRDEEPCTACNIEVRKWRVSLVEGGLRFMVLSGQFVTCTG